MRRPTGLLLSLILLSTLFACTEASPDASVSTPVPLAAEEPAEAEFCLPRTESTLHPILGHDRTNLTIAPLIWEGLFELDNTFSPYGVLCDRYTVSEDGLSWTFYLRTGVTFSDGSPLTAQEAAQSLLLAKQADTRFSARLSAVASAAPAGTHTLVVTLSAPNGNLPALLDVPIVKGETEEPLGTGPYAMESWGEGARLVRRTDWWQDKTLAFASVALRTVKGADQLIYAFDTRDISLVTLDLTGTNALGYSTGYEVWDCPTTVMLFAGFNTAKGPCSNVLLRQALSRCFDRNTIAGALFARHATAAVLPVSPFSPLYDNDLAAQLDYSAQAAADLFGRAGYVLTDGVLKKGSAQLALTVLVNSENSFKTATADYLTKELEGLGISVELRKLGWNDYEAALRAGDFDLYLGEAMLTADFDLSGLVEKTGALNYGKYSSGQTEALLAAYRTAGQDTRAAAASALYRKLGQDAPFSVLCFKSTSVLTQWGLISGLSPTQRNAFYDLSGWKFAGRP